MSEKQKQVLANICAIANQIPEEEQEYSLEVSRLIGRAYEKHISSATLPDWRMYYNIASRLIPSTLDENYKLVSTMLQRPNRLLTKKPASV